MHESPSCMGPVSIGVSNMEILYLLIVCIARCLQLTAHIAIINDSSPGYVLGTAPPKDAAQDALLNAQR